MLQQLRDKAKSFVSFILLGLLVISFGIWGIGDIFRRGNMGGDWVAKVGPMKISPQVLEGEFRKQVAQMRSVLGPDFSTAKAKEAGLLQRALDQIIGLAAVDQEAARLGLNVGADPIIASLQQTPELRNPDGSFNRVFFQRVLASQGLNEATFVEQQKKILARNILVRSMSLPITVPDAAVEAFAKGSAQRRVAEVVRVNADALSVPAPGDEALQSFYKDHADEYKTTERRSFTVVRLSPADNAKSVTVTDEDIQTAYEQDHSQFEQPEKRDIVQVVVDSEAKAKALADAAHKSELSHVAKDAGLESVSLDQMAQKDLPDALGTAVFHQGVAQIGGPVQTHLGWHVFVVEKITPGRKQGMTEVKSALRTKLQNDKAAEGLVQTANKIDDMLAGGKSLEDIASTYGLKLETYEKRDAAGNPESGKNEDKGLSPEILKAAYGENEGENSPLMEAKNEGGYVLVRTNKIIPSHVEDFAALKDRIKTDWQKAERAKKAGKIAEKVEEQLKKGAALSEVSGEALSKSTSEPVRVDDTQQSSVPREVLSPLFNLGKGEVARITTASGDIVVRVKNVLPANEKDIEARKKAAKENLAKTWLAMHLDELDKALRKAYTVKVDQRVLQKLSTTQD
ncbi:MAG: SurA N-terminal domain-containing protein [Proteobacteria bacterium]|nr:SurA N-terminal domain-containing protein [Pseudomonadota bacterium]